MVIKQSAEQQLGNLRAWNIGVGLILASAV
jgi:hypothetical protein